MAARVLVVGAGGLGSPVLAYLAGAGIGTLGVVDDDVVELSNLHRQVVHRSDGVGTAKTSSAAAFVAGLDPGVEVVEHRLRLDATNAADVLGAYDLVVDGSDNFATRYLLNDLCVFLGLPLVWASIADFSGQVGVVVPDEGPCYRCLFPRAPEPGTVLSCAEGGVLGVLPGVVGCLEAVEAVKLVTGLGDPLTNGVLLYDALAAHTSVLRLERDPGCVTCGVDAGLLPPALRPQATVRELDASALPARAIVVDVREPGEIDALPWPGAQVRSLSGWDEDTMRELVDVTRDGGGCVVLVCASGQRSRMAAQQLLDAGAPATRVASLGGGLERIRSAGEQS